MKKIEIITRLDQMQKSLEATLPSDDEVLLTDYDAFCIQREEEGQTVKVWTAALQKALDTHRVIIIPARDEAYYLDGSVMLNSGNRIIAGGAVFRQCADVKVLMLRNRHVVDGSHAPEDLNVAPDENISICGGRWEENRRRRMGYGTSGMIDADRSMYGVTTCMLFSN